MAKHKRVGLQRKWINQPSTAQPQHDLHGECVLYNPVDNEIYFLRGDVVSGTYDPIILSDGWPNNHPSAGCRCDNCVFFLGGEAATGKCDRLGIDRSFKSYCDEWAKRPWRGEKV